MDIRETRETDIFILEPRGRLDSNTAGTFEDKLLGLIGDGEARILINMGSLEYISSAGLRVLLRATREMKQKDGRLVVCCMRDYIKEVFDLAGFATVIPVAESQEEALEQV